MNRRRICLLTLAGVFLLSVSLIGCKSSPDLSTNQKPSESEITIKILSVGSSSEKACNRISKALSKITHERYGFNVELAQVSQSDYINTLNREQMLGLAPDLFVYNKQNQLSDYFAKDEVLRLNELLNTDVNGLRNQIGSNIWDTATLANAIYAVPAVAGSGYSLGFIARKDIVDALGINASDITDWSSLHSVLMLVKERYPDMVPIVPNLGVVIPTLGEDPLGNGIGVLLDDSQKKIENLYSSYSYYTMCKRMHYWYSEDLILKHAYSYNDSDTTLFKAFNGFGFFVRLNEYTIASASRDTRTEMVAFRLSDPILNSSNYNVGWCISSTSPLAKQAMQLLNLMYSDREVSELCIYGQEGLDYTRVSTNTVTAPEKREANLWNTVAWDWPNQIKSSYWKQGDSTGSRI